MFISSDEKRQITSDIRRLNSDIEALRSLTVQLLDRINNEVDSIRALTVKLVDDQKAVKKPTKKALSEARKLKQREYARKYIEKKRLEKQNANSIKAE